MNKYIIGYYSTVIDLIVKEEISAADFNEAVDIAENKLKQEFLRVKKTDGTGRTTVIVISCKDILKVEVSLPDDWKNY